MSKEYEIGKWTGNTYLIMRDKNNKVIHHYIWVKKKRNGLIGVYDLIDKKFIPFQPKTHITDYIDENGQFIDTGIVMQEVLL